MTFSSAGEQALRAWCERAAGDAIMTATEVR